MICIQPLGESCPFIEVRHASGLLPTINQHLFYSLIACDFGILQPWKSPAWRCNLEWIGVKGEAESPEREGCNKEEMDTDPLQTACKERRASSAAEDSRQGIEGPVLGVCQIPQRHY